MIEFTKPFEVGKTYKRVDGKEVVCIKTKETKHYETAQFDDYEECHYRVMAEYAAKDQLHFVKASDPNWNDPSRSGYRYNRAEDRGRSTGSKWDEYSVIPEPTDRDYVLELYAHIKRSFEP
jgi:hypothetical protein